ncbi:hypothetical protein WN48_06753 [Eufriesea mexicana]|uniref:Uncharacterized protein n=1 Tax=Eufriesea mexicana TaxID=516756 RepID=A0A310STJ5_9HYME|nr:hypothetical protein WN48_06753 [Eufriesea mexicana]
MSCTEWKVSRVTSVVRHESTIVPAGGQRTRIANSCDRSLENSGCAEGGQGERADAASDEEGDSWYSPAAVERVQCRSWSKKAVGEKRSVGGGARKSSGISPGSPSTVDSSREKAREACCRLVKRSRKHTFPRFGQATTCPIGTLFSVPLGDSLVGNRPGRFFLKRKSFDSWCPVVSVRRIDANPTASSGPMLVAADGECRHVEIVFPIVNLTAFVSLADNGVVSGSAAHSAKRENV